MQESDDRYLLTFDVPGVDRNDLNVEIEGPRLIVTGERKGDGARGGRYRQRTRGR